MRRVLRSILTEELRRRLCWAGNVRTGRGAFVVLEEIKRAVIQAGNLHNQNINDNDYKTACQFVFKYPLANRVQN